MSAVLKHQSFLSSDTFELHPKFRQDSKLELHQIFKLVISKYQARTKPASF